MNYAKEYLKAIKSGKEVVSNLVRTVYEREVEWMDNPPEDFPFYYDKIAANRPIEFIETFCKQSKGQFGRQPIKLCLFQKAKLNLVFGWKEKDSGLRRFREVVDIRGRKCGKSTETAAVEWYILVADNESGAELYCCANKLEQSKLIFNETVTMRQQSDALKSITKKRQADIYMPANFSFIKPLAADSSTMDGLNCHFFSLDEWHEAKNRKVYDVMKQSQSARLQPLAWLISTNGFVREGFFDTKYAYSKNVALWIKGFEDYRLLPLLYQLDNKEEWKDPKCWGKANPGLGEIKSIKSLAEHVEVAMRDPSELPTVLTKDFNMPESGEKAWLSYHDILNETIVDIKFLEHSYAIGGCDLSAVGDLTCATLLIKKPNDLNFYVLQKYFLPKTRIDEVESSNTQEAPYKKWVDAGYLTSCDSAMVDYKLVTQWFVDMIKEHDIRPLYIGYDRALSGYWVQEMQEMGFEMVNIPQGAYTWTYPMKQLGGLFQDHKIVYQNNPILRWCLLNTQAKSTNVNGIESIQPVKTARNMRIDGMVSLLNAYTCYCKNEEMFIRYIR